MADATDTTRTPAGQPPAAAPVDPHPALLAEAEALCDLINGAPADTPDELADPLFRRLDAAHDRLCGTPARTLDGVRAQLRHVVYMTGENTVGENGELAVRNALATLDALAGRA